MPALVSSWYHSRDNDVEPEVKQIKYYKRDTWGAYLDGLTEMMDCKKFRNPDFYLKYVVRERGIVKSLVILSCRENNNRVQEVSFFWKHKWHRLSKDDFIDLYLLPLINDEMPDYKLIKRAEYLRQQNELKISSRRIKHDKDLSN